MVGVHVGDDYSMVSAICPTIFIQSVQRVLVIISNGLVSASISYCIVPSGKYPSLFNKPLPFILEYRLFYSHAQTHRQANITKFLFMFFFLYIVKPNL